MKRFLVFFNHPDNGQLLFIRGCYADNANHAVQRVMGRNANLNKYSAYDVNNPEDKAFMEEHRPKLTDLAKIA